MKIIDRYILKEFLPPFALGLLLFTFVLLTNKIYKLTDLMVNKGVSLIDIIKLISYIMPSFLTLTIPMAVLLGALVAFGRLSTDGEVTALKASGLPFRRMVAPVAAISVVAALVTGYFSLYLGPEKARTFKKDLFLIAKNSAFVNVEEEVFNDSIKGMIIYAHKMTAPNEMEGVFISDERDPKQPYVIIARKGIIDVDLSTGLANLKLFQGSMHKKGDKPGSYQEMDFDTNSLSINLYEKYFNDDGDKKTKREMSLAELREVARQMEVQGSNDNPLLTEYYKRFTVPLACIIFAIAGPPLGLFSRRSGKSSGITIALAIFAVYYVIMKGGENLASAGRLNPLVAALLPNVVIGALGVYLVASSEEGQGLSLDGAAYRLKRLVLGGKRRGGRR